MAIITYPVNNKDFSAEDVETYMCTRTSGVYAGDMDYTVTCTGADNNVSVSDGLAWMRISRFGGKSVASKETTVLNAGLSDPTYPRIDAVVLQWSANKNGCELVIKKGKAQSNPQPPEVVRNPNIYELHLFHIKRRVGASTIAPSDLTDLREDEKYCGIMYNDVTLKGTMGFLTQKDKGVAGGVAELDSDGKVPKAQLPSMKDYIPVSDKGAANGVATLDGFRKLPNNYLPDKLPRRISGTLSGRFSSYEVVKQQVEKTVDFGPFTLYLLSFTVYDSFGSQTSSVELQLKYLDSNRKNAIAFSSVHSCSQKESAESGGATVSPAVCSARVVNGQELWLTLQSITGNGYFNFNTQGRYLDVEMSVLLVDAARR